MSAHQVFQRGERLALAGNPDREHPDYSLPDMDDEPLPFSDDSVEVWIKRFAETDCSPINFIGFEGADLTDAEDDIAMLLRNLSAAWVKDKALVHSVAGTSFFRLMTALAAQAYANE